MSVEHLSSSPLESIAAADAAMKRVVRVPGESWLLIPILAAPLCLLAIVAQILSYSSLSVFLVEMNIRIVAVVAIYMFSGNSGVLSYGHVALMGIGAYASGWQTCCPTMKPIMMTGLPQFLQAADWPWFPSALAAGGFAAFIAFLSGLIILRLQAIAASIATFALLFIFNSIYGNWDTVTMGVSSMIGLPLYVTPIYSWLWVLITIVAAFLFQNSASGLLLKASRDEETAAKACGARVFSLRLLAFTLSGFFSGMAGVLLAHHLGTISVDTFFLDLTFTLLAMLMVGGLRSLSGAVAGAATVSVIIELLRSMQLGVTIGSHEISLPAGSVQIGVAVAMLAILVFRRDGLLGGREIDIDWLRTGLMRRGRDAGGI